jgi:ArsR family transcriptional regulator
MPRMAVRAKPQGCCAVRKVRLLGRSERATLVDVARALADATRLEILRFVTQQDGPVCACDIVDHFDLSQPTISHHLKILTGAGLLRTQKCGLWAFYEADPRAGNKLGALAAALQSERSAAPGQPHR